MSFILPGDNRYLKIFTLAFAALAILSCNRKEFVEQKLALMKVADDCSGLKQTFKMTSNFGGERFEFERCLPANFDAANLETRRSGDTVIVDFKVRPTKEARWLYQVTLDIDSYPAYKNIRVDGENFAITPTND